VFLYFDVCDCSIFYLDLVFFSLFRPEGLFRLEYASAKWYQSTKFFGSRGRWVMIEMDLGNTGEKTTPKALVNNPPKLSVWSAKFDVEILMEQIDLGCDNAR